ncbi:hypothetical protein ASE12_05825 [Aeromicrobium sp. Root236]|uniref:hypothetical protein n=1 Tax=Aeromicrobium sp. Root236 TaxID=1736498 RepID=UPI0006FFBFF7|nr:hypothetical protein [Aeromicrobium sp. Root236]KRC64329.1 hypothetical protein ASE12_05825 [Aeromicrobium sp. Root236]
MPLLECKGVFELVLPDGWTVVGNPGSYYEATPSEGTDRAVNISVYPISEAMRERGTAGMLRMLVGSSGFPAADDLDVATIPDVDQERSFATYVGAGHDCFAGFLFFSGGAVAATGVVASGDDEGFDEVRKIVAMIAPAAKKGLFRRR